VRQICNHHFVVDIVTAALPLLQLLTINGSGNPSPDQLLNSRIIRLIIEQTNTSQNRMHPSRQGESLGHAKRHVQAPARGVSYLLVGMLCLTLFSSSLAINFHSGSSQHTLHIGGSPKWEGCGEINNHTVECTQIKGRFLR
jgi:hypothetical protein